MRNADFIVKKTKLERDLIKRERKNKRNDKMKWNLYLKKHYLRKFIFTLIVFIIFTLIEKLPFLAISINKYKTNHNYYLFEYKRPLKIFLLFILFPFSFLITDLIMKKYEKHYRSTIKTSYL